MFTCLSFGKKPQRRLVWFVLAAAVCTTAFMPQMIQAGNDPLVIETPQQYVFLVAADGGQGDSVLVRRKAPRSNSGTGELPDINDFVVIKLMPRQLTVEKPIYPGKAKKAGIEGDVWIKALIDRAGKVVEAVVLNNTKTNTDLAEAALDAAVECTYKPAIGEDGKPVAVWVSYKVAFRLDEK